MFEGLNLAIVLVVLLAAALAAAIYWLYLQQQQQQSDLAEYRDNAMKAQESLSRKLADDVKEVRLLHQDLVTKIDEVEAAIVELADKQRKQAAETPEHKIYSRATKMVELGASVEEIMSECELPRAEAELLLSLHQK